MGDITSNLQGWWKFEEGTGTATTADSSGNANTMTLNSAPSWVTGKIGSFALHFDGSDTYLNKSSGFTNIPVHGTTGYSVAFWVKSAQNANEQGCYSEGNGSSATPFFKLGSDTANNKLDVFLRNDAGTIAISHVKSTTVVFDNTWHHVTWTDSNGTAKAYIDGVLDGTTFNYTPPGGITLNQVGIGCLMRATAALILLGDLDEVRVYNRVLAQADVTDLFNYTGAAGSTPLTFTGTDSLAGGELL
jgi:hypothetical protein